MNLKRINSIMADFSLNLAAGWFGALIIIPKTSNKPLRMKIRRHITSFIAITLLIFTAYTLHNF